METIETIRRKFAYNEWANEIIFNSLAAQAAPSAKALRSLAHLLLAEKMWLVRLLENADTTNFDFWQAETLADCAMLLDENKRTYAAFLNDLTDEKLSAVATYRNSKGIAYQTAFRDVLTHVLFHSVYHRGQVAQAVRIDGGTPVNTDFIAYIREHEK